MNKITLIAAAPFLILTPSWANSNHESLHKCYQAYGQIEEVGRDGKKISTYKDPTQVGAECNQKVLEQAKKEKKSEKIMELAEIVGVKFNRASMMPILELAAKKDPKICSHVDAMYSLDTALARPADDREAKEAFSFLKLCWKPGHAAILAVLAKASGYTKENLCTFAKQKNEDKNPEVEKVCTESK